MHYVHRLGATTVPLYNQESNTSPLNLETSTSSSSVINLYPSQTSVFNHQGTYHPDNGNSFYPPSASSHIFPNVEVRSRLGTTSNPSPTGMAHAHRAPLPHPSGSVSTRDYYSTATPSFRRPSEHPTRSPSFPGIRHHPLSPTPSPNQTYAPTYKMDSAFGGKPQIPPLLETTSFGSLQYADGPSIGQTIKLDINGTIDKGFFLADKEWTCYRRNYFSCICSFTLTPHSPTAGISLVQSNGTRNSIVNGFAMSISAVVSDSDSHVIELVQHTPKRDKGPTARPEKVRLVAKPPQSPHHSMGLYGDGGMTVGGRYDHNYGPPQPGYPSEHTFERIQFKQATANNGKRRAAQQYYHLLVELWANISTNGGEHYVKVAHRKSAKMIVRGRSPGHYQSERRGSTSSGPGGSSGSLGYGGSGLGPDFGPGSTLLPAAYGGGYDPRSTSHYGGASRHHQQTHSHQPHEIIEHPAMTTDEVKAIHESKDYQYFPTPICDSSQDPRQPVDMFSHPSQRELPQVNSYNEPPVPARAKHEDSLPPPPYYPGNSFLSSGRCGRYEGKSTSSGYYPSMAGPTHGIGMS
ncbi:p53-like transcription protein [Ophiostoma piceae UAMH 11346]|uniref:p53-like transcription protein n=1 Tax=Ophiostoma piceae (strain UAMH 11346) TaxID=1262450 RepID=S3CA82_OPHP1|nr:p53-like transcription protein [Ophiostoma piceae UAMH 11346]